METQPAGDNRRVVATRAAVATRPAGSVQRAGPARGTVATRRPSAQRSTGAPRAGAPRADAPRADGQRWRGVQAATRPDFQLTARGAVLGLFVLCFVAMVLAEWTGWTALTGLAFVAGGGAGAWYTKRGALLPLAVSPPIVFLAACVSAEMLTASGTFATLTGIIVTLATASPWLFTGTALILCIAVCRGLPGEIADLVADLRILIMP